MTSNSFAGFLFLLTAAGIVVSCSSAKMPEIPVPGESAALSKNIASEYYSIADGYFEVKKYDKAAEYYKLAMRDKSIRPAAYYKLGRSYAMNKQWDDAETVFKDLLKRDPQNSSLTASLAYITAMKGDTAGALTMYKNLIDTYPDESSYLENYIALLIDDGKLEQAEQQLFVLKSKFPNSTSIDSLQKKIYEKLDNPPAEDQEKKDASSPDGKDAKSTTEAPKAEKK